jgi:hypothetical protein
MRMKLKISPTPPNTKPAFLVPFVEFSLLFGVGVSSFLLVSLSGGDEESFLDENEAHGIFRECINGVWFEL